jgi:hypothetical protein
MTLATKRKRRNPRERFADAPTPLEKEKARRQAAFAAIEALYAEAVALWPSCPRGACRRHKTCAGDKHACLKRAWPLLPQAARAAAFDLVQAGGPRRVPPRTAIELQLRSFPPSNFVQ